MNYIVLDMEWNYPLTRKKQVRDPFFLRGEIIQIGAVKLDAQLEVCDSFGSHDPAGILSVYQTEKYRN